MAKLSNHNKGDDSMKFDYMNPLNFENFKDFLNKLNEKTEDGESGGESGGEGGNNAPAAEGEEASNGASGTKDANSKGSADDKEAAAKDDASKEEPKKEMKVAIVMNDSKGSAKTSSIGGVNGFGILCNDGFEMTKIFAEFNKAVQAGDAEMLKEPLDSLVSPTVSQKNSVVEDLNSMLEFTDDEGKKVAQQTIAMITNLVKGIDGLPLETGDATSIASKVNSSVKALGVPANFKKVSISVKSESLETLKEAAGKGALGKTLPFQVPPDIAKAVGEWLKQKVSNGREKLNNSKVGKAVNATGNAVNKGTKTVAKAALADRDVEESCKYNIGSGLRKYITEHIKEDGNV